MSKLYISLEFRQGLVYNLHRLYVLVTRKSAMPATSQNILTQYYSTNAPTTVTIKDA